MARVAAAALLAAVEVYNKPNFDYREQTFAILIVNAWETLLKARIIQQSKERIQSIYQHRNHSNRHVPDDAGGKLTIGLHAALSRVSVQGDAKKNIEGLIGIRNQAMHLGTLTPDASVQVLSFGSASVQNFVRLHSLWFNRSISIPYLLPVGFIGNASAVASKPSKGQRELIKYLSVLASTAEGNSEYSVALQIDVHLNPIFSGGGTIGITDNPNAPKVQISDDGMIKHFPASYADVVIGCGTRYHDFSRNKRFNSLMKSIKDDPSCSHKRRLDPRKENPTKWLYNLGCVFSKLDSEYTLKV